MRFETTTSAQARTNRKQRNIGNLAKGACGPYPAQDGDSRALADAASASPSGAHTHAAADCKLCKYPATATPSIVWFAPCPSRYSI
eukprot:g60049.t1